MIDRDDIKRRDQQWSVSRRRQGFTLVELMVSIVIVTILASTVLFAMMGVQETARIERTRSQVNRLHELIAEQWESYETRRVKFDKRGIPAKDSVSLARRRLDAIREVMRMEMPDRYTDLIATRSSVPGLMPSARWHSYRRRFAAVFGDEPNDELISSNEAIVQHQGAEMLYLIISQLQDGNASALEFFQETELGDTDGDGMLEILDGWGIPISFLRWAPGAIISPLQSGDPLNPANTADAYLESPDPLDIRGLHNRIKLGTKNANTSLSFALYPLIYSAGPDKKREIRVRPSNDGSLYYCQLSNSGRYGSPFPNDPYLVPQGDPLLRIGTPYDSDGDGDLDHVDNITNHFPGT